MCWGSCRWQVTCSQFPPVPAASSRKPKGISPGPSLQLIPRPCKCPVLSDGLWLRLSLPRLRAFCGSQQPWDKVGPAPCSGHCLSLPALASSWVSCLFPCHPQGASSFPEEAVPSHPRHSGSPKTRLWAWWSVSVVGFLPLSLGSNLYYFPSLSFSGFIFLSFSNLVMSETWVVFLFVCF